MLSSPPNHRRHLPLDLHRHYPPAPATLHAIKTASRLSYAKSIPSSRGNHHYPPEQGNEAAPAAEKAILRTHQANSSSILPRHLSPQGNKKEHGENHESHLPLLKQDKEKLLEVSMTGKTSPQFPGSIHANPYPALVEGVFTGGREVYDEMLVKALEIRRKVTVEIFKAAMKKGKFGITYYENLVSEIPEFMDYVMIKAVDMKNVPELSQSTYNARVQAFIDECRVVPLIRWLKHNSLSYPQIGKLICASKGNLNTIKRLVDWLTSINVNGRFLGVAMTRAGENVLGRKVEELDEIVEYLEENGVRRDWMGYVVSRSPEVLTFSMEELSSRAEFYLNMGMHRNDFGAMVFKCPKVIGCLSMEEMSRKVAYMKEFGLSTEEVGRLVASRPQLMVCGIEGKWKPLLRYFYYLGMSKDGMRRILTKKPIVFCVDLEKTIVPKIKFLVDIGVEEGAIASMLARFPSLMTYSLYKKIRPMVIFLLTKAGVSKGELGKVVAIVPELLGCSITNKLDPNVKYFLSLGISLPVLGAMISDFPMLLRYNIDILRPKHRYLRTIMIRSLEDLIEFPRFFSYSLEKRIIPRHKMMIENRVNFKLRHMLASTDDEFETMVKEAVERRTKFESATHR